MQLRFSSADSTPSQISRILEDECAAVSELTVRLFVDQVAARLTDIPEHFREDICRELRQHIEALIAAHGELGDDLATATEAAIQQFGEPRTIASRFCRAWKSTCNLESTAATTRDALKVFSLSLALYSLSLLAGLPNGLNLHGSVDAALRSGWFWNGMWLVPSIAGAYLGWKFPRTSDRGTFYALSILTAISAPLFAVAISCGNQPGSTLYTPSWYAWASCTFLFPVLMTWLPIGSVAALVVSRLATLRDRKPSRA